jgi:hypothetical protein
MTRKDGMTMFAEDMVELSLLLPGWQAEALATEADQRGLTAGQMLRSLIREFCTSRSAGEFGHPAPSEWWG